MVPYYAWLCGSGMCAVGLQEDMWEVNPHGDVVSDFEAGSLK